MLSVYQLVIPTPYPVGAVNAYLIKNDPITLIDVGPDTKEANKILRNMLMAIGCPVENIKRIIITHAHPDHCGLAASIAQKAQATVLMHPWEMQKLNSPIDYFKQQAPFVLEAGVTAKTVQEITAERDKLPRPSIQGIDTDLLHGGECLNFKGGQLQVLHLPGHSPGHLCLYDPQQGFLFSGDFLLPHITPNPLMEPDHTNPGRRLPTLRQYLTGLDILESIDIKLVFPGHGGIFNDYRHAINAGRRHHQSQFARIQDKLQQLGESNAFQLSRAIYPNLKGWQIFLGLSEVMAHLDYLVDEHQISCQARQGINYYCPRCAD